MSQVKISGFLPPRILINDSPTFSLPYYQYYYIGVIVNDYGVEELKRDEKQADKPLPSRSRGGTASSCMQHHGPVIYGVQGSHFHVPVASYLARLMVSESRHHATTPAAHPFI